MYTYMHTYINTCIYRDRELDTHLWKRKEAYVMVGLKSFLLYLPEISQLALLLPKGNKIFLRPISFL